MLEFYLQHTALSLNIFHTLVDYLADKHVSTVSVTSFSEPPSHTFIHVFCSIMGLLSKLLHITMWIVDV
jgi:hypothetical protein